MDISMKLVVIEFITKSLKGKTKICELPSISRIQEIINIDRIFKKSIFILPLDRPLLSHIPYTIPSTSLVLHFHPCANVATCTLQQILKKKKIYQSPFIVTVLPPLTPSSLS